MIFLDGIFGRTTVWLCSARVHWISYYLEPHRSSNHGLLVLPWRQMLTFDGKVRKDFVRAFPWRFFCCMLVVWFRVSWIFWLRAALSMREIKKGIIFFVEKFWLFLRSRRNSYLLRLPRTFSEYQWSSCAHPKPGRSEAAHSKCKVKEIVNWLPFRKSWPAIQKWWKFFCRSLKMIFLD